MSLFWVAVDLAIVVWAMLDPVVEVEAFRRLLMLNGWLDVLYLVTGVVLITRKDMLARGFGAAICVQGGFLFILDWVWWFILGSSGS